jgi:hypothetical protein
MDEHVQGGAGQHEGQQQGDREGGKFFTFFVDDREFRIDTPTVTGAGVMELAGIEQAVGLMLIDDDGTQRAVQPGEVIELKPGRRFKKAPRFKRG